MASDIHPIAKRINAACTELTDAQLAEIAATALCHVTARVPDEVWSWLDAVKDQDISHHAPNVGVCEVGRTARLEAMGREWARKAHESGSALVNTGNVTHDDAARKEYELLRKAAKKGGAMK